MKKTLIALGMAVAVLIGFYIGRNYPKTPPISPLEPKVDTLYLRDTITLSKPIYVTRRVVDSVRIPVTDTIRMKDTLFVQLAREQEVWQDSLSIVYASGILPRVDSVRHFVSQTIITKEIPVIQTRRTRWGAGVSVGYGVGKGGLTPYVGVGVTYNLLSW